MRLLQYIPYNKTEAIKTLHDELGWEYYGGKHYESVFTKFSQAYILPLKFNIDKRRAHLATLICNGEISREEALKLLQEELYQPEQLKHDKNFVCKKLSISEERLNEIMNLPAKSYQDYPNNERFLKWIYKIYNFIRRK